MRLRRRISRLIETRPPSVDVESVDGELPVLMTVVFGDKTGIVHLSATRARKLAASLVLASRVGEWSDRELFGADR